MKKWTARILAMLMILALVGCGGDSGSTDESGGSDGETLQLTLSLAQDTENPVYLGAVYFADRLKELSGGTMETTVHPNSALGGEEEIVEMQSYGDSITFSLPSGYTLQKYTPAMYAADFYFQFENYDQVWAFYDGAYGDYVKESLDGTGLVVTSFWDNGFRNLTTTNREVHTAGDLKGVKLRVMSAETHMAGPWSRSHANCLFRDLQFPAAGRCGRTGKSGIQHHWKPFSGGAEISDSHAACP